MIAEGRGVGLLQNMDNSMAETKVGSYVAKFADVIEGRTSITCIPSL